ncbi:MAG: hypothetical protein HFI14_03350 [Lachnospiraceae bacterium]|nr:hypothetical protein [Lachnospiraceae bacterium]
MINENRTLFTLEERLKMAAESQAASPEAAAKLVQRLSGVHTAYFFCGSTNKNIMEELTGEFWDGLGNELLHYGGFCRSFRLAIERDDDILRSLSSGTLTMEPPDPYQPVWSVRTNNALVLLGLLLLDHAKGGMRYRNIYRCMRMNLKQYLDALVDLSFQEDGTPDEDRAELFWIWRETFLKDNDGAWSLKEVLGQILRRYIAAWQEFDHLDHILRCMGALSCYLEQEEAGRTLPQEEEDSVRHFREALCRYGSDLEGWELIEQDKRYLDPRGYYFSLAYEYPEEVPDPGSKNVAPGTLRSQIFLSERDYSPEALRKLAAKSPSQDLRELLEMNISEERLACAMREINIAVMNVYMLFVEPYLRMGEYHYERHLE